MSGGDVKIVDHDLRIERVLALGEEFADERSLFVRRRLRALDEPRSRDRSFGVGFGADWCVRSGTGFP